MNMKLHSIVAVVLMIAPQWSMAAQAEIATPATANGQAAIPAGDGAKPLKSYPMRLSPASSADPHPWAASTQKRSGSEPAAQDGTPADATSTTGAAGAQDAANGGWTTEVVAEAAVAGAAISATTILLGLALAGGVAGVVAAASSGGGSSQAASP